MKLTKLEQESLNAAFEYAICDYEQNLILYIQERECYDDSTLEYKASNEQNIKIARKELGGMQRAYNKLFKEI